MKLIILRGNLKEALQSLERAVTENNNLPILKNILLKADSRLTLIGTNLEIAVTYITAGKITEEGSITIPFTPFYSIINNSSSERINLATSGNTLVVKTDNYEAKIQGIGAEEFPIIPKIEDQKDILEMDSDILSEAIGQVMHAAQVSAAKPELNSILFDFQLGLLKLVATDGFRLAEKTLLNNSFSTTFSKGVRALIPLKTISEVVRIFPKGKRVVIRLDEHQISFSSDGSELISRLIDGTYPDYTAIIPKNIATELTVARDELINAVKLVSNFSGRTSDVKMRLKEGTNALEVFAANQLLGENNYLIPVKRKKGNGLNETAFNWRYLLDGIRPMPSTEITIGLTSETKPAVIKPVDDDSLFYIVMPIQA